MENTKRFDEISIMRVLAMTMIVAFHSMCFYNGRWVKVNAITIPFWTKVSSFLDVVDLNMFVFISGYLYGYLYIYRNKAISMAICIFIGINTVTRRKLLSIKQSACCCHIASGEFLW